MPNKNRYKHKQSGYCTLMLVPTSTSKVLRLKIPHWLLYAFFLTCLLFVSTSIVFSLRSHELRKTVTTFSTDLEESIKINEEMESETIRLNEQIDAEKEQFNTQLKKEREKALTEMQREKEGYINSLEYYEDRLNEFQELMDQLEEATQEIYEKLGKLNLPASIQKRLVPMEESSDMSITLLSLTYSNEDIFSEMDNKIVDFEAKLQEKKLEFETLDRKSVV